MPPRDQNVNVLSADGVLAWHTPKLMRIVPLQVYLAVMGRMARRD